MSGVVQRRDGTRAAGRRRGPGELEGQVLAALWAAPGPVTAAWVRERIGGAVAHTTVLTILTRLQAKGAVTRERAGRSFVWTAAADAAGLAAHRMRRVLDAEQDRAAVLAGFVSGLSTQDEHLLRALLGDGAESDGTESAGTENSGTGSDRVGSGRVGSGRVGSGRVGSGRVGSDRAESDRVEGDGC
nr:BlaI/MecI/CopY family transcriptional regulator [Streptomyces sp. VRA16 Mangrove soil]